MQLSKPLSKPSPQEFDATRITTMEKKSELLTQSIMVDFGITEEEMAAIGGGVSN